MPGCACTARMRALYRAGPAALYSRQQLHRGSTPTAHATTTQQTNFEKHIHIRAYSHTLAIYKSYIHNTKNIENHDAVRGMYIEKNLKLSNSLPPANPNSDTGGEKV
jgi:hypothetical protein